MLPVALLCAAAAFLTGLAGPSPRRAGAAGRFTATFTHAVVDRCSGFTLTAIGAYGSHAKVHRAGRGCPPA